MANPWDTDPVANAPWSADQLVKPGDTKDGGFVQGIGNLAAGAVRGAGSIGATLLWPIDKAADMAIGDRGPTLSGLITGDQPVSRNEERRQAIDAALQGFGAQPDSSLYKVGKVGGEIAGTLGVGGAAANVLTRTLPGVATAIPAVVNAVRSGGFMTSGPLPVAPISAGANVAARMIGGAGTGAVASTLVNPDEALTGAIIGGSVPPVLQVAGKLGNAVGSGAKTLIQNLLGMSTGVGPEPLRQAFKAGVTGNTVFKENLAGDVPLTNVLDKAKAGLDAMRAAKSAEYRSGMIPVQNDKTVLDFSGIDQALQDASALTSFKGQVKNDAAASAVAKMRDMVDAWKKLDPAQFHTPEGLDALKQKLGSVLEGLPINERTARLAAGKVYNAAKSSIEQQAPTYADVMRDYSSASEQISEIERALSLGDKASKDTAMRKLQSLMRNNVQTNYGNRLNLANTLEQKAGVEILPDLAGQALNSWTPRSLSGQLGSGATALGAMLTHNPFALAALPLQSPRLVGSAAYGLGRVAGGFSQPGLLANQAAQGVIPRGLLGASADRAMPLLYLGAPALAADR